MEHALVLGAAAAMASNALLTFAHLRLRHRHRLLRSTLRRVADERNAARWARSAGRADA